MKKAAFALALLGLFGLLQAEAGAVLTLPATTQGPKKRCIEITKPQPKLPFLYKENHFKCYQNNKYTQNGVFISFENAAKGVKYLGDSFQNKTGRYSLMASGGSTNFGPEFFLSKKPYFDVTRLFASLVNLQDSSTAVIVRSFSSPEIQIGNHSIKMNQPWTEKDSKFFYSSLNDFVLQKLFYNGKPHDYITILAFSSGDITEPSSTKDATPITVNYSLRTLLLKENTENVIMSLSRFKKDTYILDVAPIDKEGRAILHIARDTKFVDSPSKLTPYKQGEPLPTLLLRLTNTPFNALEKGIFLPR